MLDRPTSFKDRFQTTWPATATAHAAIETALQALAMRPDGSQRRGAPHAPGTDVFPSVAMHARRPRSYACARASGAF